MPGGTLSWMCVCRYFSPCPSWNCNKKYPSNFWHRISNWMMFEAGENMLWPFSYSFACAWHRHLQLHIFLNCFTSRVCISLGVHTFLNCVFVARMKVKCGTMWDRVLLLRAPNIIEWNGTRLQLQFSLRFGTTKQHAV